MSDQMTREKASNVTHALPGDKGNMDSTGGILDCLLHSTFTRSPGSSAVTHRLCSPVLSGPTRRLVRVVLVVAWRM